jgi:hypothetical protein
MTKRWQVLTVLVVAWCLVSALANVVAATSAGAQQVPDAQRPPLVTDFAAYPSTPQAFLGPTCDFTGVLGSTYTVALGAGGTAGPVGDLAQLPVLTGPNGTAPDVVTWTWTGVTPACVGSAVSMVVKVALGPSFDPNVDQLTGPNGGYVVGFLTAGPGTLTFPMPDLARFGLGCDYQLDAIVGIPLQDVGPSGSFFSGPLRQQQGKANGDDRTTVLSAKNGTYPSCTVPPSTTVPVTTPLTAPSTTVPPTTAPPTTPPTTGPPTTPATVPPTTGPPTTVYVTVPASSPPTPSTRPPLVATGARTPPVLPLAGIAAVVLGLILVARWRRPRSI